LNHLERQDRAVLFFVRFISELGLNESGIDQKCEGSGANGRIWPAMMSAELPEGWAWAS
jgi:hypothetical protein